MTVLADLRKVRNLQRYQRLMAKRSIKSQSLWWLGRILTGIVFGAMAALAAAAMSGLGEADAAVRADLLDFFFLGAGAFVVYLQLMVLFNRLCVISFDELLASPLSGRAILMERIYSMVAILPGYTLLAVPLVVTYGVISGASAWYYPLAVLAALLTAVALFVFALVSLVLLLFVLRRRVSRDSLALFSSLVAIAIFVLPRLLSQSSFVQHAQASLQGVAAWSWVPLLWGPRLLVAAADGSVRGVTLYGVLLLAWIVMGGWFAFAWASSSLHDRIGRLTDGKVRLPQSWRSPWRLPRVARGEKLQPDVSLYAGTAREATEVRAATASVHVRAGLSRHWLHPLPPGVRALVRKDWLRLRRTPGDFAGMLFSGIYFWFILLQSGETGLTGVVMLAVMACLSTLPTVRLGLSSFGMEREQVILLLQAPLSLRALLLAKWLYAFVPSLLYAQFSLIVFALLLHPPLGAVLLTCLCTAGMVAAATMITLPFAISGASFVITPRQGRQRNTYTKPGASFSSLAQLPLYAVQAAAILFGAAPFWPSDTWLSTLLTPSAMLHWVITVVVSLATSALVMVVCWRMAAEAWRSRAVLLRQSGALD